MCIPTTCIFTTCSLPHSIDFFINYKQKCRVSGCTFWKVSSIINKNAGCRVAHFGKFRGSIRT